MTVQAAAVRRRLASEQDVERQSLEAVEASGREALAEMRRMVAVLRGSDGDASLQPLPGLDQLERLARTFSDAGLPLSVTISGQPRDLPPGLGVTACRLVQEGLTNTLRHARNPRRAEVVIDYGVDHVTVVVRDDGQPSIDRTAATPEIGNGLMGMQERVALYRGSLVATLRPEGGFELSAILPLPEASGTPT